VEGKGGDKETGKGNEEERAATEPCRVEGAAWGSRGNKESQSFSIIRGEQGKADWREEGSRFHLRMTAEGEYIARKTALLTITRDLFIGKESRDGSGGGFQRGKGACSLIGSVRAM